LSFQFQSRLQSSQEHEKLIKTLKLKSLKTNYDGIKSFLTRKRLDNEKLMTYLVNMNQTQTHQASISTIQSSLAKLNEYSARLHQGMDDLQVKYEEKILQVEAAPVSKAKVDLTFDSTSFDRPQLISDEVDTLRLLISVSLNSRPQVISKTTRPLGPPPGLPPCQNNNLTSIRAAIEGPRSAAPLRPHPISVLTATTAPTPTAPRQVAAAPAAAGKSNSYQKLLARLEGHFSQLSANDALRYIDMLRSENNGKLSGLSMQTIYERVGQYMRVDRNKGAVEHVMDNNCSICLEDMMEQDSRMLNPCSHKFHNQCINDWLATPGGAGNTCPMCRHFIIQEDEYPDLSHCRKRR